MAHITPAEAKGYTAQAASVDAENIRLTSYIADAGDFVALYASTEELDEPLPADYVEKAKRAELRIFDWLWKTEGGLLTSKSVGPISKGFANKGEVAREIVRLAMGEYYTGAPGAGAVEIEPLRR